MEFRQLFDVNSCTYTYLLADPLSGEAVVIDPVLTQLDRDLDLIGELGLTLKYALDTHLHADHVTALGLLRARTGCRTGMSAKAGVSCADIVLEEEDALDFGGRVIRVLETPGHTITCLTYLVEDFAFTGDALLVRGCGRTDLQGGDPERLFDSITQKLFSLPESTRVYPAHDYHGFTSTTIGEEKRLNPRLAQSKKAFVDLMKNLNLAAPKMLPIALSANSQCGDPVKEDVC